MLPLFFYLHPHPGIISPSESGFWKIFFFSTQFKLSIKKAAYLVSLVLNKFHCLEWLLWQKMWWKSFRSLLHTFLQYFHGCSFHKVIQVQPTCSICLDFCLWNAAENIFIFSHCTSAILQRLVCTYFTPCFLNGPINSDRISAGLGPMKLISWSAILRVILWHPVTTLSPRIGLIWTRRCTNSRWPLRDYQHLHLIRD